MVIILLLLSFFLCFIWSFCWARAIILLGVFPSTHKDFNIVSVNWELKKWNDRVNYTQHLLCNVYGYTYINCHYHHLLFFTHFLCAVSSRYSSFSFSFFLFFYIRTSAPAMAKINFSYLFFCTHRCFKQNILSLPLLLLFFVHLCCGECTYKLPFFCINLLYSFLLLAQVCFQWYLLLYKLQISFIYSFFPLSPKSIYPLDVQAVI